MIIFTHLGLGDNILCNGLIRHFAQNNTVTTFAKTHNINNVKHMYRDNTNIIVIAVSDDEDAIQQIQKSTESVLLTGYISPSWNAYSNMSFDEIFYKQAGLNISDKFTKAKYDRDYDAEEILFNKIITQHDYIFVHDDDNHRINTKYTDNKQVIRPVKGLDNNLFEYLTVIERAKEVHCMNSSVMNMIDMVNAKCNSLFLHQYIRYSSSDLNFITPKLQLPWKFIK